MAWLSSPEAWMALVSLTLLEIVLGIDNIIFISVLAARLPPQQRERARLIGLSIALFGRLALLLLIAWIMRLQATLFTALGAAISGRDLILIVGGLFLIAKATVEIHHSVEGQSPSAAPKAAASFAAVLVQITLIDMVFSLDSVITAVGMAEDVEIMVIAMVLAVGVMMLAAGFVARFVERHPTVKMLALSFLVLIGTALIADGIDVHVPKGYIYFAMAFSVAVEMLNIRVRRHSAPVELRKRVELPADEADQR
jgi:predicted tellurium resistance membrane protein TerC